MFKWPDPPDGKIIVRLPFEIYWATSLSITLILGFGMYIWSAREKPDEWRKTVATLSRVGVWRLLEKKGPVESSHPEKPNQDSPSMVNTATTKSSNDKVPVANAQSTKVDVPNDRYFEV